MITKDKTIQPFKIQRFAILDAMRLYGEWKKVWIWGVVQFWIDLIDHLITGFVVSRPTCFWMAKIINISKTDKPELAWFVRMAIGDLNEMFETLPIYLPKIAFCRRNDGRVRAYQLDRLILKARGI